MYGVDFLKTKLNQKRTRVLYRYKYYDMKHKARDFGISTPPRLRNQMGVLGWCGKSVDALGDRLVFREFEEDNLDLNNIFRMNNMDILCDSAITGALISSCDFIYISADEEGFPRMQVIDGANATGIIDPVTYMLQEGYAVLERDKNGNPTMEAYFQPGVTTFYPKGGNQYSLANSAPHPLLVPIINRPDAVRPFGHSRISRACMNLVDSACRTLKRAEISAEFYSFPQKYAVGTEPDRDPMESWSAAMSAMMEFSKDEDGDKPTLGQFQQASQSPHTEQLRTIASAFAGETGLTLDDLGFSTDNPSSAEAIKASHENLRLTARKAQRTFGVGFLNAGYLAACVRDNFAYRREILYLTKPKWEPIFEPDAAMLSSIGDGAIKLNQAVPGYLDKESIRDLTGIEGGEGDVERTE